MNSLDFAIPALGVILVIIGIGFFGWLKILKETNKLLKEQNAELKTAHASLSAKYDESIKQNASMQGQIDVLKSIPLVNIDSTLKQISDFNKQTAEAVGTLAETNKHILDNGQQILSTLEKSAEVLKADTKAAAVHAEEVKTNLESKS